MLEVVAYHINSNDYDYPILKKNDASISAEMDGKTLRDNPRTSNFLTFDGPGINLTDDNLKFYETGDYTGYQIKGISDKDSDIEFIDSNAIMLDTQRGYPPRVTILFKDHCCNEIKILYYDRMNEAAALTETVEVNSDKIEINLARGYVRPTVYFTKTVTPNQYVWIDSIVYGTVTTLDRFTNVSLIEEINVLSDDLPINQLEFTMVAENELFLDKRDIINVWSNKKYYGTFWVTQKERTGKQLYSITAQNSISFYDNVEFSNYHLEDFWKLTEHDQEYGLRKNLVKCTGIDIVTDLSDKIDVTEIGDEEFDKSGTRFKGFIPLGSARKMLCAVGWCIGAMVDGSRSEHITLRKIPKKVSSVILNSDRRILGEATFKKSDTIKSAKMHTIYGYTAKDSETLVCPAGKKIYFENPPAIKVADPNSILVNYNAYSVWNNESSDKEFVIYPVSVEPVTYVLENSNATSGDTKVLNCTNFNLVAEHGFYDSTVESNPYVYSPILRDDDVKRYMASQGTITAKIRLRDEKVGDLIRIETAWDGVVTGIITKMTISFGYEDIADIEVLQWNI